MNRFPEPTTLQPHENPKLKLKPSILKPKTLKKLEGQPAATKQNGLAES